MRHVVARLALSLIAPLLVWCVHSDLARAAAAQPGNIVVVRPEIVPSIHVSNALFAQPSNNNWQRVPVGTLAPLPLDFLLFDAAGQPIDGVGVVPADLTRYPRYTGGLLVQDRSGRGDLDLAVN